jgi:hypothetical protein
MTTSLVDLTFIISGDHVAERLPHPFSYTAPTLREAFQLPKYKNKKIFMYAISDAKSASE